MTMRQITRKCSTVRDSQAVCLVDPDALEISRIYVANDRKSTDT